MINVKKRNGTLEPLDIEKIHAMTIKACEGLEDISASQIEVNARLQFYDGITTSAIQSILVRSAADLISIEDPNYQFAAARLLLFGLTKVVYGSSWQNKPKLKDHIQLMIANGLYDSEIIKWYSDEEFDILESYINYDLDMNFSYASLRQIIDKYLIQNRTTKHIYETPQQMYMLIALVLFHNYPEDVRLDYVKRYYDAISTHKINLPTPILAGVRTPNRQYSSCVLIDVEDSLNGIFSSDVVLGQYTAKRAGIGLNIGKIRGINSQIRNGEVSHTGIIPFLKKFEATGGCCTQNGIRGGAITAYCPIWHQEIEDIIVLKNNKGSENNRVRNIDYAIQISKLFYERFLRNEQITLFSPHNVPNLIDKFGLPEFDELYIKYENDNSIPKTKINAKHLFYSLMTERFETGRIYIMNIDHSNSHSSYNIPITMSNLCCEVTLPTSPVNILDGNNDGEIALCILSAVNISKIDKLNELEEITDLICRGLNELITHQEYLFPQSEIPTIRRRSLGIGIIGLAEFLAKNKLGFQKEAFPLIHKVAEYLQYYLLKSSNEQAKENGKCLDFDTTKYSKGILPIDTYKSDINEFANFPLELPWEDMRNSIKKYGLYNTTLTAQMPSESSSVVADTTNGVEPPRDYLVVKKSKKGTLKQLLPSIKKNKKYYTLAWENKDNSTHLKIMAILQKFMDQSISTNVYYNPENFKNREVPMSVLIKDTLDAYKYGLKTLYYANTYDSKVDPNEKEDKKLTNEEWLAQIENVKNDCDACAI